MFYGAEIFSTDGRMCIYVTALARY